MIALNASSVFAPNVRRCFRPRNQNGGPHVERSYTAEISPRVLESFDAFHTEAERLRRLLLTDLAATGQPINVWRVGQLLMLRARASTEEPPFTHPE